MIVLQSVRLDISGRFLYRIEPGDGRALLISEPQEAAAKLRELGVKNPEPLIAHVQVWGIVEIIDRLEKSI